jgi:single-strand DNA-binding protein
MTDLNTVTIIGRLGRDPELNAAGVCKLRVANTDRVKDRNSGEYIDYTNWFDVTAFGKTAEHCAQYLSKGRQIAVQGRLRYHDWEQDGAKRSAVEVLADRVQFIGPKQDGGTLADRAKDVFGGEFLDDEDIEF